MSAAAQPQPPRVSDNSVAIPGMTMTEIRQAMCHLRSRWDQHCEETPICPTEVLFAEQESLTMTMEEFAYRFVLGHHKKRHAKSATAKHQQQQQQQQKPPVGKRKHSRKQVDKDTDDDSDDDDDEDTDSDYAEEFTEERGTRRSRRDPRPSTGNVTTRKRSRLSMIKK
jgi:hypothetical protein